MKQIKLL